MTTDQHFECQVCLFSSERQELTYDALGYPICPICEHPHNPLEETLRSTRSVSARSQ